MTTPSIMATVADTRCTHEFVASLFEAGMRSVRINSAHVDPDTFRLMVSVIRGVSPSIAILMDTKGPEIRTTGCASDIGLASGMHIDITSGHEPTDRTCIRVRVDHLDRYLTPGEEIMLDDGEIALRVDSIEAPLIHTTVVRGGTLGPHKTVAFRSAEVPPLPAVSDRDRIMIAAAAESGIDMIAHSFVRSSADVVAVRKLIEGSGIRLYAKIECSEALMNLDGIAKAADGLLIARGDLGTHIPLHSVPAAQWQIASCASRHGKPAILATQILQSMMSRPLPTRAELSDITLAVLQGIDTLLLCGETAQGDYPAECVRQMKLTIDSALEIPCRISTTT